MMVRGFLRICHIAAALLIAAAATASERGLGADIDKFMAGYARDLEQRLGPGARVEYNSATAASADIKPCPVPLSVSAREQTPSLNRVTLYIACGGEWSIYLPLDIDVYRPVVVANKPLPMGAIVAADDVELSSVDVSQLVGTYLTTLDDAVGKGVKRPLAAGRPIFSQQLESPVVVRRGETVVISAETRALAVKMTGTALADGRRGEQIRIKNQTTSRIVDAIVTGPGQVKVPM